MNYDIDILGEDFYATGQAMAEAFAGLSEKPLQAVIEDLQAAQRQLGPLIKRLAREDMLSSLACCYTASQLEDLPNWPALAKAHPEARAVHAYLTRRETANASH